MDNNLDIPQMLSSMMEKNSISPAEARNKIMQIEEVIKCLPCQMDLEPVHHFAKGIYARELFLPAGVILTGKIHKTEHINIISMGDISVITEDGIQRIKAPCTMVVRPGIKRVGFTHTDTIWTTIHATTETDLEKLEEELIAPSYDEFFNILDAVQIGG